jgi:hypothetical protein
MHCQRCNSDRVLTISGKCSDCCNWMYKDKEQNGYAPIGMGVDGGDYISITYCLECGQLQGDFPISEERVNYVMHNRDVGDQ